MVSTVLMVIASASSMLMRMVSYQKWLRALGYFNLCAITCLARHAGKTCCVSHQIDPKHSCRVPLHSVFLLQHQTIFFECCWLNLLTGHVRLTHLLLLCHQHQITHTRRTRCEMLMTVSSTSSSNFKWLVH